MRNFLLLLFLTIPSFSLADSQTVFVQVRFVVDTPQGTFSDALYFTQAEFAASTPAQRNALIAARVAAYRQSVLNPPTPPTPTRAEFQRDIDGIDESRAFLLARRAALLAACAAQGGCQ